MKPIRYVAVNAATDREKAFAELPVILTTKEVADALRLPVQTVSRLIQKGAIKGTKAGKAWRVNKFDLAEYYSIKQEATA